MTAVDESTSFATLLRQFRAEAVLTQEALAERAELSTRSVQKLERGESLPYPVTVQRLARALRLTAEQRAQLQAAGARPPKGPAPVPSTAPSVQVRGSAIQLPTGVVTLLFTDMEGSTRRWERYPDAMPGALARHDALVRSAIESHRGCVFKTVGDQFCAAFAAASDALAAALAAQRALLAEPWRDVEPILVRMAVHTGAAEEQDGDYAPGPTLNRVARLLSTAHGGQTVVSAVTVEIVGEELPADVHLRDLGEHRLRDLARPERIFQLVTPDLPTSFPPLRIAQSLDSHYEAATRAITEGRVVLFLGEQVNLCGRGTGVGWRPGSTAVLPTGSEVAAHLAKSFGYPDVGRPDLLRVAQYVSVMRGSGPLYEALHTLFDADYRPNSVHEFIASLPAMLRERERPMGCPLIVTTNFDDALERALAAAGEPFDLVVYAAEGERRGKFWHQLPDGRARLIDKPNKYLGLSLDERPAILKIHGAVSRTDAEWDSFVITEDDYLDYLTRADISSLVPVTLAAKLRKSHYLFLGYSLRDWNLRVILHRLWGEQRLTYRSWAAPLTPDPMEQELWRKRDVDLLPVRLEDYIDDLREHFFTVPSAGDGTSPEPP